VLIEESRTCVASQAREACELRQRCRPLRFRFHSGCFFRRCTLRSGGRFGCSSRGSVFFFLCSSRSCPNGSFGVGFGFR
jgi:hypothetical protein